MLTHTDIHPLKQTMCNEPRKWGHNTGSGIYEESDGAEVQAGSWIALQIRDVQDDGFTRFGYRIARVQKATFDGRISTYTSPADYGDESKEVVFDIDQHPTAYWIWAGGGGILSNGVSRLEKKANGKSDEDLTFLTFPDLIAWLRR